MRTAVCVAVGTTLGVAIIVTACTLGYLHDPVWDQ